MIGNKIIAHHMTRIETCIEHYMTPTKSIINTVKHQAIKGPSMTSCETIKYRKLTVLCMLI